ncbi:MAG: SDR family NAD(P)-dependent oxidoreductase [Gammaproteobacteria bacterium]
MNIEGTSILITGACGGIGSSLIEQFVLKKAKKIYATDLNIHNLNQLQKKFGDIIVPLELDVTQPEAINACKSKCQDIDILVNNAGIECATSFLNEKSLSSSNIEMAVNYFGVHNLCFTFWTLLKEKKSAAIVNILSIASFSLILKLGTYCASKTATHLLTQALRKESEGTSIKIYGVYPGYVDTKMTQNINVEKASPQQIAIEVCDGIENGILNIFPDPMSTKLASKIAYESHIFCDFNVV